MIFFILLHNRAVGSASISTMVLIGRFVLRVFEYVFVVHLQRPLWVPVFGFLCPLLSHTRTTTHLSPIHSLLLVIYHSLIRYSFVDCCLMVDSFQCVFCVCVCLLSIKIDSTVANTPPSPLIHPLTLMCKTRTFQRVLLTSLTFVRQIGCWMVYEMTLQFVSPIGADSGQDFLSLLSSVQFNRYQV